MSQVKVAAVVEGDGVAVTIQIPQPHLDTAVLLLPNSDNTGSSNNGSNNSFCSNISSSNNNNGNLKLLLLPRCLHRLTNLGTVT